LFFFVASLIFPYLLFNLILPLVFIGDEREIVEDCTPPKNDGWIL